MDYVYCTQSGQVFWGLQTHAGRAIPMSLYRAMLRPGADRSRLYALRVFFG